jgi:uncharacterized protein (DUF58 family)
VDAHAVGALSGLLLRARTTADGALAGLHLSHRHGRSLEFAEHKVYAPGDDTRRMDWKAFARFNRYYVKRYIDETALRAFLVCDLSNSMSYAGGTSRSLPGPSKAAYAKTLCATLAWLLVKQADAVGYVGFAQASQPVVTQRGGDGHLAEVLAAIDRDPVGGPTDPRAALALLANHVSRRSLVIACTDLMDAGRDILEPLGALRTRGADVALLHVLHPDELHFPYDGVVRFLDLEGDREAQVDARAVRDAYVEEVRAWVAQQESAAWARGIDHHLVTTDTPPARAILSLLAPRRHGD